MQTVEEIRLRRLELLVTEAGSAEELARRCDTAAEYLSQLRSGKIDKKTGKPRKPGSQLARKLERRMGKPVGWMDMPLPDDQSQDAVYWPFDNVPPALYRQLPDEAKAYIAKTVTDQATLAGLIQVKSPPAKPKGGARPKKAA